MIIGVKQPVTPITSNMHKKKRAGKTGPDEIKNPCNPDNQHKRKGRY